VIDPTKLENLPSWQVVIRPDARLWSFRLSGGMSVGTFMRTLAPAEPKTAE
jgi:hypothetical protein